MNPRKVGKAAPSSSGSVFQKNSQDSLLRCRAIPLRFFNKLQSILKRRTSDKGGERERKRFICKVRIQFDTTGRLLVAER